MKPKISIVIAVRSNWRQLDECLASVAAQALKDIFEVLVIDDGSEFPRPENFYSASLIPVSLYRQTRLGIAAARNRGIHLSQGEIILFTDSDCRLAPDCLRNLLLTAQQHPDEVAFQLAIRSGTHTLTQQVESFRLGAVQELLKLETGHIRYANTSGFVVLSSYARKRPDFFDTSVLRGSDTIMLANLIRDGWQPLFIDKSTVVHCPEMSFASYARKHFQIGYHNLSAYNHLRRLEGILLDRSKKLRVFRCSLSETGGSWKKLLCLFGFLLCLAIEKTGHLLAWFFSRPLGETNLLGVRLNVMREPELIYHIASQAECGLGFTVSYANAWTLVQAQRSSLFRALLNRVDLCLVDGVGVSLASLMLRGTRALKITFNDLIFDICGELAGRNLTVAMIGGEAAVVVAAASQISQKVTNLRIILKAPGYLSKVEEEALIADLVEKRPNVILIGLGQPLQEEWAAKMKTLLPGTVFLCVGGLFDYLTGPKRGADCARRLGVEWAFRFCCSPRKNLRRYLYGVPALFAYILIDRFHRFKKVVGLRDGGKVEKSPPVKN